MIVFARTGFIQLALTLALAAVGFAQTTPPQQPGQTAPPPTAAPADKTGTPASTQQKGKPAVDPADLATGDGLFSIELFYWQTPQTADLRGGSQKTTITPGDLDFPGKGKFTPGAIVSIPLLKDNTIRVSYFRATERGDGHAPTDLNLFGTGFAKGVVISTRYTLQDLKISLDYLSYPFPVKGSKFRLKTLWELQYVTINGRVAAPLLVDSTGAADPTVVTSAKNILLPTFGLALERSFGRRFRVEARASGFTLPGRSTLWDADAAAAIRAGRFEVLFGGKAFHFKTSPKQDNYYLGTLAGAYVGLRYYWQ